MQLFLVLRACFIKGNHSLSFYVRDTFVVIFSHERLLAISVIILKILSSNVPVFSIMSLFIAVAFLLRDIHRQVGHLEIFL